MKRIALIGNVNNNFFSIARHLRDRGYDAHLFYRFGVEHFQPQADTFKNCYSIYCHEIDWLNNGMFYINEKAIRHQLQDFDFYIGQGDEAAAAYRAGLHTDVYYPYGSDVYKYSKLPQEFLLRQKLWQYTRSANIRQTYKRLKKGTASKSLRGAITTAKSVLVDHTNEDFESQLSSLNFSGIRHYCPMPFIYSKEYEDIKEEDVRYLKWKFLIDNARQENDLLILYHGRQEWKSNYNDFTPKNTHHLIIGFANYVKQYPSSKVCLIMLEYGHDLGHSKQLVNELGIDNWVMWLPKMYRKEIMYLISKVDICSGEFGRSYLTFGTIIEAMIMKKPVIHYRNDDLYKHFYPELYPLLNAREPDEIMAAIASAAAHKDKMYQMGEHASQWVKKYFIEQPLQTLIQLIEAS